MGLFTIFLLYLPACATSQEGTPVGPGIIETKCCRVSLLYMPSNILVDLIFEQVQLILHINYKKDKGLVNIELYRDQEGVAEARLRVTGLKKKEVAFYLARTNTIYLSLDDVTEGVLAHEMAHAVIHMSIFPLPPFRVREKMAQRVEQELNRNWEEWPGLYRW